MKKEIADLIVKIRVVQSYILSNSQYLNDSAQAEPLVKILENCIKSLTGEWVSNVVPDNLPIVNAYLRDIYKNKGNKW